MPAMATAQDRGGATFPPPNGSPTPPDVSPAFLLMNLGRLVRTDVETLLRRRGSSLRHLSALGHLSREPGISYSELARRAGITAQSMQATLRQLENLGLVERRTEAGRGRTAELYVTAAGHAMLEENRQAFTDVEKRLLATMPEADRGVLNRLLLQIFLDARSDRTTPVDDS
jgi:DNA-binding MarR family transcriptional regulator